MFDSSLHSTLLTVYLQGLVQLASVLVIAPRQRTRKSLGLRALVVRELLVRIGDISLRYGMLTNVLPARFMHL